MNYVTSDAELTSIANAIRAKTGGTDELTYPDEFVSEIGELKSNASVETVLSAIRNKFPENMMDLESMMAEVESGVRYTVAADVTYDGNSHVVAMSLNANYNEGQTIEIYTCDEDSDTPAEGTVKHKTITFTASGDGSVRLVPSTGCTLSNVTMVVGSKEKECWPAAYTFPADYARTVSELTSEEATGVNF